MKPNAVKLMMGTAIVMLVMWIGALVTLGMQQAWGRFVAVLVLHLLGLGIVGMSAYGISGPEDPKMVVIRPSTPVSQAWS
jgi:purine-cytosine permease-like protein